MYDMFEPSMNPIVRLNVFLNLTFCARCFKHMVLCFWSLYLTTCIESIRTYSQLATAANLKNWVKLFLV